MPNSRLGGVDLMKELRLRRWARENYVPEEERGEGWHPIVMEEMGRKDAELREEPLNRSVTPAYVPLMPDNRLALHEPHTSPVDPHVIKSVEPKRPVERSV